MYYFINIILLIIVFCILFSCIRQKKVEKAVRHMTCSEKCRLISDILSPLGYCYSSDWDIISTRNNAWQGEIGYRAFFDKAALHFNMSFDALPVYFHYQGATWLIELWKGQYGVSTGAEVGVYRADGLLSESELSSAPFRAVEAGQYLPISFTLRHSGTIVARLCKSTWWLTAFLPGIYSKPSSLTLDVSICFPDATMQEAFCDSLIARNIPSLYFHCRGTRTHIHYTDRCPLSPICPENISFLRRIRIRWVNFSNRLSCQLYRHLTRHFCCTLDKILYLYKLLPFSVRRILRCMKGARQK